ncbi:hypothetical protein AVEN_13058-1 [Araneus ventricosus]|uniref:Uncharacterized protein n=1 Tax=Araneus ventricosus TaxID=182803 RepID=A0A4Y2GP67_ARAVE|nr:hypothetical protein AVEN_13058-1 [Araneus ventricosus]
MDNRRFEKRFHLRSVGCTDLEYVKFVSVSSTVVKIWSGGVPVQVSPSDHCLNLRGSPLISPRVASKLKFNPTNQILNSTLQTLGGLKDSN